MKTGMGRGIYFSYCLKLYVLVLGFNWLLRRALQCILGFVMSAWIEAQESVHIVLQGAAQGLNKSRYYEEGDQRSGEITLVLQ